MASRVRPALDADERTQLLGWYRLQRQIVELKAEGLSDDDAHRVVLPTSPLMTVAGVISHLTWVEHCWFQVAFRGADPAGNPAFDESGEDLDFVHAHGRRLADVIAEYREQCARSDEVIASASLDDLGVGQLFASASASLRWMVIHMIEETARHAGHLDIIRELIDGERSYT